jgi:hypothetical protein
MCGRTQKQQGGHINKDATGASASPLIVLVHGAYLLCACAARAALSPFVDQLGLPGHALMRDLSLLRAVQARHSGRSWRRRARRPGTLSCPDKRRYRSQRGTMGALHTVVDGLVGAPPAIQSGLSSAYAVAMASPSFGLRLSRANQCGRLAGCDDVCHRGSQEACGVSRRAAHGGLPAPWHPATTGQQSRVPTSSISIVASHC